MVDLLLAAGTKASLRAAHAAEQGTAPKQAAELAKAPKCYRKSPDDREASTRYVRENVAFSLGDILAKFAVKNWDNYTAELNWLAKCSVISSSA